MCTMPSPVTGTPAASSSRSVCPSPSFLLNHMLAGNMATWPLLLLTLTHSTCQPGQAGWGSHGAGAGNIVQG